MANLASMKIDMQKVQTLALDKFWTMSELSRQADVSVTTLLGLKAGRQRASLMTIRKISAALGVSMKDITKQ